MILRLHFIFLVLSSLKESKVDWPLSVRKAAVFSSLKLGEKHIVLFDIPCGRSNTKI